MYRMAPVGVLLAGLILSSAGIVRAQAAGGHMHTAPHGGEVVGVAEHHVEFKAEPSGAIAVWLLSAEQKPVAPPAGGRITLLPDDGDQVAMPLKVDAAGRRLVARFDPARHKAFEAVVSLPLEGKRRNFRFHYPPVHHH